jgi:CRP-like cAMP-binding protein
MLTSTLCPVEAVFTQTALLARLSRAERRRLASHATVRSFAAGTTIVREGDTSMAVYVILYGKVAVHAGSSESIRELGAGEFFGEIGVIDDAPRSASVVALEPTRCALLGTWDVRDNPRIALSLLPVLARRLRESVDRGGHGEAEWINAVSGDTL